MNFGHQYRARLRQLLNDGSFSREPGREKLMKRYLDEWDKWANMAYADQRLMKYAEKYLWVGFIPSVLLLLWVIFVRSPRVDRQFQILQRAQADFYSYTNKFGSSKAETEALEVLKSEARS